MSLAAIARDNRGQTTFCRWSGREENVVCPLLFRNFNTREEAKAAIFEYIEIFYNRQRLHQTLDYVSPVEFERRAGVS
jgi:transposase InsO family protein